MCNWEDEEFPHRPPLLELPATTSHLIAGIARIPIDQRDPKEVFHPPGRVTAWGAPSVNAELGDGKNNWSSNLGWMHAEYAEYKLEVPAVHPPLLRLGASRPAALTYLHATACSRCKTEQSIICFRNSAASVLFQHATGLWRCIQLRGNGTASTATSVCFQPDEMRVFERWGFPVVQAAFARGAFGEVWRCARVARPVVVEDSAPHTCVEPQEARMPRFAFHGVAVVGRGKLLMAHMMLARVQQPEERFVLKRILVEKGAGMRLSGERERHFGQLFKRAAAATGPTLSGGFAGAGGGDDDGFDHLVRYVESFETQQGRELWLVFRDEGTSLHSLMYEVMQGESTTQGGAEEEGRGGDDTGGLGIQILQPSRWWWRMRKQQGEADPVVLSVVRQVIL